MDQESQPAPRPAAPATPAAPIAPNRAAPDHARWTPAKQRIFLAALLECGSVARAARAAGMSRSSAHVLRRRLVGTPFDRGWAQALELHARRLADPFAGYGREPTASRPSPTARPASQGKARA